MSVRNGTSWSWRSRAITAGKNSSADASTRHATIRAPPRRRMHSEGVGSGAGDYVLNGAVALRCEFVALVGGGISPRLGVADRGEQSWLGTCCAAEWASGYERQCTKHLHEQRCTAAGFETSSDDVCAAGRAAIRR